MRSARAARGGATVLLGAVLLTGCGLVGGDPGGTVSPSNEFAVPESQAPEDVGPITEQPRDTREVTGDGFSLFAPAEFQQSDRKGPGDVPMIVLGKTANRSGGVVEVVVFNEAQPQAGAQEQMYGLEGAKEIAGAQDIRREAVEWPDAKTAVLVRWTERTAGPQGELTQTFAQLAVERENGSIVTAIAVAPQDEFDDSGAMEILRTLTLDGA